MILIRFCSSEAIRAAQTNLGDLVESYVIDFPQAPLSWRVLAELAALTFNIFHTGLKMPQSTSPHTGVIV